MNSSPEFPEKLQDNLVAYLDGELNESATQNIEQTLSKSADARHEVDVLSRIWELLDYLPRAGASDDFTERTVASVKVKDVGTGRTVDGWWFRHARRGAVLVVLVAGLTLSAAFGFMVGHRWPGEEDQLVEELPLIKGLDVYAEVDSVGFLKELQKSGLFDDETE